MSPLTQGLNYRSACDILNDIAELLISFLFTCDPCMLSIVCMHVPSVTGHFGHKTLRHQDTLGHFGTGLKTLENVVPDTSTRVP